MISPHHSHPTNGVRPSDSNDALGRIASLSIITNDSSNIPTFQHSNIQTFTYSYLLGTDLVDGYTCGNFSRKIEFEPLRNLVAAVTNSYANRVISAFDYTNDAAGRRTAISRSGEAFGDLSGATDSYGYNSRNEVISARRTKNGEIIHGFNEDFEYDPIGNRIWSTTYNELGEPKTSQYIANNLNQYTSRTVLGYAAVRGHADADATVTVNEKPTYRYGEYFFGSNEFDNSQFAVEAELVTSAVLASPTNGQDEVASVTSRVHIAKSPQLFEYDDDGNLLNDGYYTFTYDSDNRLKTVSTNSVLVLTNIYDAKSRRVKKVTADAVITFFYDDWNLVEERIVYANGAMTTIHYCWGTDLSGTLHGAGGVGGLLYLTVDDEIYIPCYDNNGNITQYIDVNGYSVASYAYDSFGGIITKSGPLADFFRHRFSTKYFDTETCLYYYGYRFYSPCLARWLNRDPIEEDGGVNLYSVCGNNLTYAVDPDGLRIYITIERRLNEDRVRSTGNGTGRGLTEVRLTSSISCSRCRLQIKGRYTKIMYVLSPENEKWNRRLSQYNRKWGYPRSNNKEREATIAHEMDHWQSWSKVESFINELNSKDGKFVFFCSSEAARLREKLRTLADEANTESDRYDREPGMNQGGMYR